ncbi:MAG: hypothetical protein QNK04_29740 [Myxococcota bacterium]|nr:hypothetical protein [Myxococcota bacterium]
MAHAKAYRRLCAGLGGLLVLGGVALFASFFGYHAPGGQPRLETGPVGYYFVGFAGSALVAWGGCLIGASRRPAQARSVGTWSAVALVMMAVMRITGWIMGDYYVWPGELLRVEAVLFLLAALAFVWLRPPEARRSR